MTTYTCDSCGKTHARENARLDDAVLSVKTEWIATLDGAVLDGGSVRGDLPEDDLHFCDWNCLSVYAADVRDGEKGRTA